MNALDVPTVNALLGHLRNLREDTGDGTVGAVLITGGGARAPFCAGADLSAPLPNDLPGLHEDSSVGDKIAAAMTASWNPLMREIRTFPVPVVAAVGGACAGGGVGIALSADVTIVSPSAFFLLTFGPKLSLIPDLGSTWLLPRLVGRARALSLAMLGERLGGREAADAGLVYRCVEGDDELMPAALAVAERLARGPSLALTAIRRAMDCGNTNSFDRQLELERDLQRIVSNSPDFAAGIKAFLRKKRRPSFDGGVDAASAEKVDDALRDHEKSSNNPNNLSSRL